MRHLSCQIVPNMLCYPVVVCMLEQTSSCPSLVLALPLPGTPDCHWALGQLDAPTCIQGCVADIPLQHSEEGVGEGVVDLAPCCIQHLHLDLVPRQHQGASLFLHSRPKHTTAATQHNCVQNTSETRHAASDRTRPDCRTVPSPNRGPRSCQKRPHKHALQCNSGEACPLSMCCHTGKGGSCRLTLCIQHHQH